MSTSRWSTPADIKATLLRRWERGDLLTASLSGADIFPIRLPICAPSSREFASDFSSVRDWITTWRKQTTIPCEWKASSHRIFGSNEKPAAAVFNEVDTVVALLGVRHAWKTFEAISEQTRQAFPELLPWLAAHPVRALELSADWSHLLAVIKWIREHPHCGLYLRQMDIPGIHTKFVETHPGVLAELLDLILSPSAINTEARGAANFSRRYGFLVKPERIRFRFLDLSGAIGYQHLGPDLKLEAPFFARLNPPVSRVFITENEVNFLAFPNHPKSLIIFGSGYGWSSLNGANWLARCEVYYWGDIDTHGFAILDQLRRDIPHAKSFLMDGDTFQKHRSFCSTEPKPYRGELHRLSPEERTVYNLLRHGSYPDSPRLEQERISFSMIQVVLQKMLEENP